MRNPATILLYEPVHLLVPNTLVIGFFYGCNFDGLVAKQPRTLIFLEIAHELRFFQRRIR